jgi:hypothetical protein
MVTGNLKSWVKEIGKRCAENSLSAFVLLVLCTPLWWAITRPCDCRYTMTLDTEVVEITLSAPAEIVGFVSDTSRWNISLESGSFVSFAKLADDPAVIMSESIPLNQTCGSRRNIHVLCLQAFKTGNLEGTVRLRNPGQPEDARLIAGNVVVRHEGSEIGIVDLSRGDGLSTMGGGFGTISNNGEGRLAVTWNTQEKGVRVWPAATPGPGREYVFRVYHAYEGALVLLATFMTVLGSLSVIGVLLKAGQRIVRKQAS